MSMVKRKNGRNLIIQKGRKHFCLGQDDMAFKPYSNHQRGLLVVVPNVFSLLLKAIIFEYQLLILCKSYSALIIFGTRRQSILEWS